MRRVVRWIRDIFPLANDQRGQTIIIFTFAFVGLVALVGLVTDGALLYVHFGHLRRAVDAAAVSAVNQYREGREIDDLYAVIVETLQLQLPGVHNVRVYWYNHQGGAGADTLVDLQGVPYDPHDPGLGSDPPRKRVRVEAELPVNLVFLRIVWGDQVVIRSGAEAEAAVLNMVLLLDTSESMAYTTCPPSLPEPQFFTCLEACRADGNCQPFDSDNPPTEPSVRWAAFEFVETLMRDGVDQVSVYHFDRTPVISQSVELFTCEIPNTRTFPITLTPSSGVVIPLTTDKQAVLDAISQGQGNPGDSLNVYIRPAAVDQAGGEACERPTHVGGWWGEVDGTMESGYGYRWASTNIGGGLRSAIGELVENGSTDAAIWVVVLLSDGAANATDRAADGNNWWTCPSPSNYQDPPTNAPEERDRSVGPFCRDPEATDPDPTNPDPTTVTRHCPSVSVCSDSNRTWYTNQGETDTDRVMWFYDADDYARDIADLASSEQIAIYTIGFGPQVIGSSSGRADAGERLLRYVADVGDDGDLETAPCGSDFYWDDVVVDAPPMGEDCGNYYHAQTAADLTNVFEDIVSRIFSRITR